MALNSESGLPSNNVHDMILSSNELLYLATDLGIYSFDGRHYEKLSSDIENSEDLFFELFKDSNDSIWTVSRSMKVFLIEGKKLKEYQHNSKIESFRQNLKYHHIDFFVDSSYNFYLSANTMGYIVINEKGNINSSAKGKVGANRKQFINEIEPNKFFIHPERIDNYLLFRDNSENVISFINEDSIQFTQSRDRKPLYFNYKVINDTIIFCIGKHYYIVTDHQIVYHKEFKSSIISIETIGRSVILGFHSDGFRHFRNFAKMNLSNSGLKGISTTKIIKHPDGPILISTIGKGVFFYYDNNIIETSGFNVSCSKLLNYMSTTTYKTNINDGVFDYCDLALEAINMTNSEYQDIIRFNNGLYLREKQKLMHIDRHGLKTISCPDTCDIIKVINKDSSIFFLGRHIWKENENEIKKIIDNQSFTVFTALENNKLQEGYFVGSSNGIFKLNEGELKRISFSEVLNSSYVSSIDVIGKNEIIVGTQGSGLFYVDLDELDFFKLKNEIFKPSSINKSFNNVSDSIIWFYGNSRVFSYQYSQGRKKTLNTLSNLIWPSNVPIKNVFFQKGRLIIVGNKKSISIDSEFYSKLQFKPKLILDSVTINNQKSSLSRIKNLASHMNNVKFYVKGINLFNSNNSIYRYRFKNRDITWVYTTQSEVSFNYLIPGAYILEIQFIDLSLSVPSQSIFVEFNIKIPMYKKWWFSGIIFLISGLIGFAVYVVRERNIKEKTTEKLRQAGIINQLELNSLRSQLNPHFIFNSVNNVRSMMLVHDNKRVDKYLTEFAHLFRQILDKSHESRNNLKEELDFLKLYVDLENIRFDGKIEFKVNNRLKNDLAYYFVPSLILQPFVENCIVHGFKGRKSGRIYLECIYKDDCLVISIEDNGVGRSKIEKSDDDHKPIALTNSKKRLELNNSLWQENFSFNIEDLYGKNGRPSGTKVLIYVKQKDQNGER